MECHQEDQVGVWDQGSTNSWVKVVFCSKEIHFFSSGLDDVCIVLCQSSFFLMSFFSANARTFAFATHDSGRCLNGLCSCQELIDVLYI